MTRTSVNFLFLNLGHFYNHLLMLVFATIAALALEHEWGMSYAEIIPYSIPGLIAYGVCTIPSGWFADKWSRTGMMFISFTGTGISAILTASSTTPFQLGTGLLFLGVFASIYHPVGLALVAEGHKKVGLALAVNGIFGNLGVAAAALITGYLIDWANWQAAFILPGAASVITGLIYAAFILSERYSQHRELHEKSSVRHSAVPHEYRERRTLLRVFFIVILLSGIGGMLFQSTTFALPKVLGERLSGLAETATEIGEYAFIIFFIASFAQLAAGYTVDRLRVRSVISAVILLQIVSLFAMQYLDGKLFLLVSLLLMISIFGQIPIVDVIVSRVTRPEWRGRAYAVRNVCSFISAPISIAMISWLHTRWGFSALFLFLSLAACLSLCSLYFMPQLKPHGNLTD